MANLSDLFIDFVVNLGANETSDAIKSVANSLNGRGGNDFADEIFIKSFEHFVKMVPADLDALNKASPKKLRQLAHKTSAMSFLFAHNYIHMVKSAMVVDEKSMPSDPNEHNIKLAASKTGKKRKKKV